MGIVKGRYSRGWRERHGRWRGKQRPDRYQSSSARCGSRRFEGGANVPTPMPSEQTDKSHRTGHISESRTITFRRTILSKFQRLIARSTSASGASRAAKKHASDSHLVSGLWSTLQDEFCERTRLTLRSQQLRERNWNFLKREDPSCTNVGTGS